MADNHDLLTCPLCAGRGEVRRAELLELAEKRQIAPKIDACLVKNADPDEPSEPPEVVLATGDRNFQKDVHSWNPQLPMWRRSPKE
jgi:hypothetical protein